MHGKGRLRLHAIRLKPNVQDPRRLTSERFSAKQRPDKYHWFIKGRPVCQETYAETCALGETCMQEIRTLACKAKDGFLDLTAIEPGKGVVRQGEIDTRECAVVSFLDSLARSSCDAIPNGETVDGLSSDPDTEVGRDDDDGGVEWRLPFRSARFVWRLYARATANAYSYPRFLVKWWQRCKHIKRAGKGKDGFCQCDDCVRFKRGLMDTRTPPAERRRLIEESEAHNTFQMANRARYAHHITKAERALHYARLADDQRRAEMSTEEDASRMPALVTLEAGDSADAPPIPFTPTVPHVVSMVLDCGSSQKMGTLPAFGAYVHGGLLASTNMHNADMMFNMILCVCRRDPKSFNTRAKLECKAMGVIIHGIWRAMLLFPGSVGHGANMTCESIDIALQKLESLYGCLPSKLYIQLDNCSDNKCATVLAYLYDLRRRGCLDKVTTCMLIVGHTHIDIDQWFGVFSRALTRQEALSLPCYERVLKEAFALEQNRPDEIRLVEFVHDWDAFYAPALDPKFKGFSAPKCFKFKGDANGEGRMFYKDFMISKEDKPRPYQPGEVYKPRSQSEARLTYGALWDSASDEDKNSTMTIGVRFGGASFDRRTRLWKTELLCGAAEFDVAVTAPSPGIRVLLTDPGSWPEVAATPEKWYKAVDGDSKSNVFCKIERTVETLVADGFFRLDRVGLEWWRSWITAHRPRPDGGCDALDIAMTVSRTWPLANRSASSARPDSEATPSGTARIMADSVEYSGFGRSQRAKAQAHLDEANPRSTEVVAVVGQLVVLLYSYEGDETKRVALGKVLSVGAPPQKRVYSVHWMCRSEAQQPLTAFGVNGKYRMARTSDFRGKDEQGQLRKDESIFSVSPEDIVCVLVRTRRKGADVVEEPVLNLNDSGTIPNFKLATGVNLRMYIASALAEQGAVAMV